MKESGKARAPPTASSIAPNGQAEYAGFAKRAHDLKHTFGHRLEAAGVCDRDCQVLLGHARKGVTRQYLAPEVARLLHAAESVLNTERHGTIPLTIIRRKVA